MASVFFMQPLGQVSGNIVSLVVIAISRSSGSDNLTRTFDQVWRWVLGIGVLPGVVGILFRVAIPETPRFLLDIEDDPIKAEFDATELFGENISDTELEEARPSESNSDAQLNAHDTAITVGAPMATLNSSWQLSKKDIIQYFWVERNYITLIGTSLSWLLLDFGFYGIGLSSPKFLAKTWGSLNLHGPSPLWKTNDDPNANVFDMFFNTSIHALLILNLGSVVGGVLMIFFASKLNRVSLQKYGFLVLAILFVILGAMFITTHTEGAPAIVLYVLGQLFFNFGPNSTTYILPAELFPTRYRASCHGISAAAGKLGSILVQIFSTYYSIGSSSPGNESTERYGKVLIVFGAIMVVGAAVTHFMVPEVQEKRRGVHRYWGGKAKTLEELAVGRAGLQSSIVVRSRRRRELE